jgi:glycerol-3-phosphate acyltransferase PlsY
MFLIVVGMLIASYLIGSIPVGLGIVKLISGKDVRQIGSGRIGGTNAMRAAGFVAGLVTALLDAGKGIIAGYLADLLVPGNNWAKVAAVIMAVLGQVYSIFLMHRNENNKLVFHGGAGGSTTLGGAIALFHMSWVIILPLVVIVFVVIGYASVTTISIALFSFIILLNRAITNQGPWEYVLYGVSTLIIVLYALRPNLQRLKEGTERAVGLRAYLQKKLENQEK